MYFGAGEAQGNSAANSLEVPGSTFVPDSGMENKSPPLRIWLGKPDSHPGNINSTSHNVQTGAQRHRTDSLPKIYIYIYDACGLQHVKLSWVLRGGRSLKIGQKGKTSQARGRGPRLIKIAARSVSPQRRASATSHVRVNRF